MPALPDIETIFADALTVEEANIPVRPSRADQPDPILGLGELTDASDPPAISRLADSEIASVERLTPDALASDADEAFVFKMIPVLVTQIGGLPGNSTTKATFVYDITDLNGNQLGTSGQAPLKLRHIGRMIAPPAGATGTGFNLEDGTFVLFDANEVMDTGVCP